MVWLSFCLGLIRLGRNDWALRVFGYFEFSGKWVWVGKFGIEPSEPNSK